MPDDFEDRLAAALRAEANDLPFTLTADRVEARVAGGRGRRWRGAFAASAGALLVIVAVALGTGRGPAGVGKVSPLPGGSPFSCPVTRPNGVEPPSGAMPFSRFYGSAQLMTGLADGSVIEARPSDMRGDGSADVKWGWWRGTGVKAPITAEGHRLDASAPPLRVDIPDGYGLSGFQVAGLVFATSGCWEVTARAGTASVTFVTLVTFPAITVTLPAGTFQADASVGGLCLALVVRDTADLKVPARWWPVGASGDCTSTTSSVVSGTARLVGGRVLAIDIPLLPSGVQTLQFAIGQESSAEIVTEASGFGTARPDVRFRRVDEVNPTFAPVS